MDRGRLKEAAIVFIYLSRKWVDLAEKDSGYAVSAAGRVLLIDVGR